MAYVPNASDPTQPTEDKTVESAALEFRTIKPVLIRTLRFPAADAPSYRGELPVAANRAGRFLAFDSVTGVPIPGPLITDWTITQAQITGIGTVATNISAILAAEGYAEDAATQAGVATTKASEAGVSANNAATSAANAATSAAAAAASLDNFDDRYLGPKASAPTLDNDGNPLLTGALYYRTTAPIGMKVYDGSQWIEASAAQQASLVTFEYVATASQTTFSGADANGVVLSYTVGNVLVAVNGVRLRPGDDFTASNGTSVVLLVAAAAGDEILVDAFKTFEVANTYTQAQVDAFAVKLTGAQTVAGIKTFSDRPVMAGGVSLGSNGQIQFPATQNASSDANTLDDYEEGTFTITATGTSGSITGTWTASTCSYVKIGKTVTVSIPINGTDFGFTSLLGYYKWIGLPFTPANSAGGVFTTGSISAAVAWHVFLSVTDVWFYAPMNTTITTGGTATITYNIA
jgi:hypothetical protein